MTTLDTAIAATALAVSGVSLFVSVGASVVAYLTMRRADENASIATMVTVSNAFGEAWRRFLRAGSEEEKQFEFGELCNVFEIACAATEAKPFRGIGRELTEDYLCDTLDIMSGYDYAQAQLAQLHDAPKTYKYVKRFLKRMSASGRIRKFAALISSPLVSP